MAFLAALRERDFRLFFGGQLVSQAGDMVFLIALTYAALELSPGAAALGIVFAAYSVSQVLLLLVGGVLVDRFPRRVVVVASDVVQGALVAVLALAAHQGWLTVPLLAVFGALFGAAAAVAMPAVASLVPETVPRERVESAASLYQGARTLAIVAGPVIGGLVVAKWGVAAAFGVDALTFAVSAVLLAFARGSHRRPRPAATSAFRDARDGLRYVKREPWIWIAIVIFAFVNLAETGPRNVGLPLLVEELGGGADALGLVHAVAALGAVAAFVAAGGMLTRENRGRVAYASIVVAGIGILATAFSSTLLLVALAGIVRTGAFAVFALAWETALGLEVHEDMRGRVNSIDLLGSYILLPLSSVASAVAADVLGARWTFLAGGALIAVLGVAGLLIPKARRYASRDGAPPTEAEPETTVA